MTTANIDPGSSNEATVSLQKSIYDPGYVNAMSHFYRGEMGRIRISLRVGHIPSCLIASVFVATLASVLGISAYVSRMTE